MSTMSAPNHAPKTKKAECCSDPDCGCGRRNNYFFGKRLSPDSFQVEQRYALERRRLLNRAIHGWGVVYGFDITVAPPRSLTITPGLALDESGRELLHAKELTIAANELIALDEKGKRTTWEAISTSECLLLSAHYAEQGTDAVKVNDPCQCERTEWNYTCETVRFSLQSQDCAKCCEGQACEWKCGCESPGWCGQPDDTRQRGGSRYLCDHIARLAPGPERDKLCEIDERCGSVSVDLHNRVPLACVKLVRSTYDGWAIDKVDACGPRRLVMSNDVLFDLIRGCDLTYIKNYGWREWHRGEMSFDQFLEALGPYKEYQDTYVTKDFWVEFSCPVRKDTLRPDCFAMTIMAPEREGGWWQTFRVPIVGVDTTQEGEPEEPVRRARIIVDSAWVEDGVRSRRTVFKKDEIRIELEVRGDFIIDCNGQMVDANGNGTPGGTFVSTFLVQAAPGIMPERKNEERIKEVSR